MEYRLPSVSSTLFTVLVLGDFVPLNEIIHLFLTFIACALGSKLAISSHIFHASLLSTSSWGSAHRLTRALCSSCGHLPYCSFCVSSKPSDDLGLVGLSLSVTTLAGLSIRQNSTLSRLIWEWSSQCRVKMRKILHWERSLRIVKKKTSIHAESWWVNIKIPADWII